MKYERKTLSPLNAQIDKKTVLYICCCDTLFVVVLTLHSARMLPKIYSLRSKGNDSLLGLLLFLSFHQHAAACQSWFYRAEQE